MALLKQSTAYTRMFLMVQSADHITPLTGATVTVTVSKAGAAFGAPGGTVTAVSSGWYKIALNTTDTNTLGELAFHATATSGDPTDFVDQITDYTPAADALLDRDMATGTDNGASSGATGRTVRQALRFLRNKWSISGATLTVTKEDDSTTSWTSALTATPGASPITASDPA